MSATHQKTNTPKIQGMNSQANWSQCQEHFGWTKCLALCHHSRGLSPQLTSHQPPLVPQHKTRVVKYPSCHTSPFVFHVSVSPVLASFCNPLRQHILQVWGSLGCTGNNQPGVLCVTNGQRTPNEYWQCLPTFPEASLLNLGHRARWLMILFCRHHRS